MKNLTGKREGKKPHGGPRITAESNGKAVLKDTGMTNGLI
jgi:hypothetical protein